MDLQNLTIHIAGELLEVIRPHLGSEPASAVVGTAKSGDYTFGLDEAAEAALPRIIREAEERSGLRLACYSEDRGLVAHSPDPEYVLVIDPIDGTRPAMCGFESCCVSVALAPLPSGGGGQGLPHVPLASVKAACLIEIKSGRVLSGARGQGVRTDWASAAGGVRLSEKTGLRHLFWAHEICGRPTAATQAVLGRLIDASSLGGGCFVFNSSSYAISRIVLGQLDAYVDPFAALLRGRAGQAWAEISRGLYGGRVFGLFPYDIAAAAFLAEEAGATVTDARGESIGGTNLLDSSPAAVLSCVAASNAELHRVLLREVEEGLRRAEELVGGLAAGQTGEKAVDDSRA